MIADRGARHDDPRECRTPLEGAEGDAEPRRSAGTGRLEQQWTSA
jgi:hypothetical protein